MTNIQNIIAFIVSLFPTITIDFSRVDDTCDCATAGLQRAADDLQRVAEAQLEKECLLIDEAERLENEAAGARNDADSAYDERKKAERVAAKIKELLA